MLKIQLNNLIKQEFNVPSLSRFSGFCFLFILFFGLNNLYANLYAKSAGNLLDLNLTRQDPFSSTKPSSPVSPETNLSFIVFNLKNADAKSVTSLIKQDPSLIAPGGGIGFDERTNILIMSNSDQNIERIKILLKSIDLPIAQINIEARIVEVDKTALKELGITQGTSSSGELLPNMVMGSGSSAVNITGSLNNSISNPAGILGLSLQKLPGGILLDLELQALETEGEAKVISSPKLTVLNDQEAIIEQGSEVPYLSAALNGATQVQFKKAVLSLKVRPEITADHQILLRLQVNKDKISTISSQAVGTPVIDTREIRTEVNVQNGQTLVLGGIEEELDSKSMSGLPGLSKLPGIGWLFRTNHEQHESSEMLIFITPVIQKL